MKSALHWSLGVLVALCCLAQPAAAQEPPAQSLDDLLDRVRAGWRAERAENERREATFRQARSDQQRLLAEARERIAREEARSESLETTFQEKEENIAQLEETLRTRLGNLGELFGVVRQVAGDTGGQVDNSLVSAQIADRSGFLAELGQSRSLPSIESLEQLWYTLYEEMTESGKVVRFPSTVTAPDGSESQRDVIRVGAFNAISDGRYLRWVPETRELKELARQPGGGSLASIRSFESATGNVATLAIDPSRGAILSLLVQTPDIRERVEQGGAVGYAIITLGILAGLVGLARLASVFVVGRKVAAQQKEGTADEGNPLGRVIRVYENDPGADPETLELQLDEAVLRESGRLDRFLWAIRVVSVVAPLMGLLGTVTGMIRTFQAITLFGTGDPKLMAGGISEALVTTMLGLLVAIPLLLLHAMITSSTRKITDVLEEQSAGMVAERAVKSRVA
ncbi:MAG: MotA/TolQ/ExbB proton channel family protein [Myxococcota bacterium]|nr:MotA/TolQ/ExbB proton channel family protein [Myxococcota bacterium]